MAETKEFKLLEACKQVRMFLSVVRFDPRDMAEYAKAFGTVEDAIVLAEGDPCEKCGEPSGLSGAAENETQAEPRSC